LVVVPIAPGFNTAWKLPSDDVIPLVPELTRTGVKDGPKTLQLATSVSKPSEKLLGVAAAAPVTSSEQIDNPARRYLVDFDMSVFLRFIHLGVLMDDK
jgi:hypothetical protein